MDYLVPCLKLSLIYGPNSSSLQHLGGILPKATSIQQRQRTQLNLWECRDLNLSFVHQENVFKTWHLFLVRAGICLRPYEIVVQCHFRTMHLFSDRDGYWPHTGGHVVLKAAEI